MMGATIITIKITMADDEWDRFDKRHQTVTLNALKLMEYTIDDALMGELGLISNVNVTKIE